MTLSFSDHVMTVGVDLDSMESTASNEWEALGEEFGKSILQQMELKVEYSIEGNKISIQNPEDSSSNVTYELSKDGDNIIFMPSSDDKDSEKMILKPYTKKDKAEQNSNQVESEAFFDSEPSESSEELQENLFDFSADKLTTPLGTMQFTGTKNKTTIDDEPTIFIEFDYTNTTDETQNIENLIWDYFDAKQVLENTTESLQTLILMEDDGDYERYNNTQVEVNPGSTVQAGYGFVLKDSSYPLTIEFMNDNYESFASKEFE